MDILYITSQQLYDCDKLPEWKDYIDKYHQYLFGDEDERFQHVYAVLEDCPEVWVDEQGSYKRRTKPSEWITRSTGKMSNSHHQISTIIAERFIDAIAKIKAEAARVMAEQKANIEAQTEERIAGYCEEITQLKNQLKQNSKDHAEEITKVTSDAQESIAREKTRADENAEQIVKARTEIAEAITEQKKKIETAAG